MRLSLGGSIHDPTDPTGRLLFNVLAMIAEFEADLTSMRTREGLKVVKVKAKGRLRGKQPKLSKIQSGHQLELYAEGTYTTAGLAELFSVNRATVYRTIHRDRPPPQDLTDHSPGARSQRLEVQPLRLIVSTRATWRQDRSSAAPPNQTPAIRGECPRDRRAGL